MTGLGPVIQGFGGASEDVDGRHKAGHDDEKTPAPDSNFNRTAVAGASLKSWMPGLRPA
jgi:hypothetical protein